MKRHLVLLLAPCVVTAVALTASAAKAAPAGAAFSGSCTLSGTVAFDPPLTTNARPTTSTATATGTCSGTLAMASGASQSVSNAAMAYHASEYTDSASCNLGVDSGSGSFSFAGYDFPFSVQEDRATGAAFLRLTGSAGGSALASARISTSANPVTIVGECAGAGLSQAPIDGNLQTTSPLQSAAGKGHVAHDVAPVSRVDRAPVSVISARASSGAEVTGLPLTAPAGGGDAAAGIDVALSVLVLRALRTGRARGND